MHLSEEQKKYQNIKSLFLSQAYQDAWEDYNRSVHNSNYIKWDYVILTASNEAQAEAFRLQINERLQKNVLPAETKYAVLADPEGKRVGSGGATFNVIRFLAEELLEDIDIVGAFDEKEITNIFDGKRILVIHSGGDSKRVPQYSAIGKLFSPVPRRLPDGRGSTLFDEFMIGMAGVPSRIKDGMLVLSGDVLLLFNALQIDGQLDGAAAISIKESVTIGKNHGVFLSDGHGYVKNFLHKQTEESLKKVGAVSNLNMVDLDTGAILLGMEIVNSLYGLISTDGKSDSDKFERFVNDKARVSFYGDFLYPLASDSTLEQYYNEKPEGEYCQELRECRALLWEALSKYKLKLICLSPAKFIHFGTTKELLWLMTEGLSDYAFLDWKMIVQSTLRAKQDRIAAYQSYVGHKAEISENVYLEESYCLKNTKIGIGSIISHIKLEGEEVPGGVVLHGLPLCNNKHVVRIYGILDNPKGTLADCAKFLTADLKIFMDSYHLQENDLWDENQPKDLWNAKLYPECVSEREAVKWALKIYEFINNMTENSADTEERLKDVSKWLSMQRTSLANSFNQADLRKVIARSNDLNDRIASRLFIDELEKGSYYENAFDVLGKKGMTKEIYHTLMNDAVSSSFSSKIRIYYAISRYMKMNEMVFDKQGYEYTEMLCFEEIQKAVYSQAVKKLPVSKSYRIAKDTVDVQLPVRVNWGGGWTDTPPYCMEKGGVVLNAAIKLNGIYPVQIKLQKLDEFKVVFESQDIGVKGEIFSLDEIQNCHDPYDSFALHKAALIACGIIPIGERSINNAKTKIKSNEQMIKSQKQLQDILQNLGGGIYLSTQVVGIPKGSGLGTSSILAGACVKGIFEFLGLQKTNEEIYEIVLCMEQIMSTGGGWQDQVGGLTNGIKLITTESGMEQDIKVNAVQLPDRAMEELQNRFALIYTGQRRLARNLLREIVGSYIGSVPSSIEALEEMKTVAFAMTKELEAGNIEAFGELLNKHWMLSKKLDAGSTNGCIDQIFLSIEDLIDAKFIAGAGGGGFLMVLMKKGITKEDLQTRLEAIFQDSGVGVWDCSFV